MVYGFWLRWGFVLVFGFEVGLWFGVKLREDCCKLILICVRIRCGMRLSDSWISKSDLSQTWMLNRTWVKMRILCSNWIPAWIGIRMLSGAVVWICVGIRICLLIQICSLAWVLKSDSRYGLDLDVRSSWTVIWISIRIAWCFQSRVRIVVWTWT